ncbi:putative DNA-binding protein [Gorillibacterium timonense]|uniref:putative DNA-binding protein n=1 Tax=Gorillibacterium timonense TaxID=1689269 RepID=UPI00071C6037|nr:putative DNA-binding protein [Gorillibacterium timonense]
MSSDNVLEKTTRVNLLFDFYGPLLTEKQQTFLTCYFLDDLSLGEIASEFAISRQAVYEHIRRAEATLESYEEKLGLAANHERRTELLDSLKESLAVWDPHEGDMAKQQALACIEQLEQIED